MKIVRARTVDNKLEVNDNRPFAIDVELMDVGFKVKFLDLMSGEEKIAAYADRLGFDKEWRLYNGVGIEGWVVY